KEVLKVAETHQVQARFQNKVHELTSMCWDKCITTVSGNGFTRGESDCLTNCVDRFLDTSMFLVKTLKGDGR
ncbi:Tim10/DDP family zinc finger protein, partial [Hysterangium stoloniferum]